MRWTIKTGPAAAALLAAVAALGGCATSRLHISDDFGRALRQDTLAQVSDPDAKYVGVPDPGSHGDRVGLAQDRYVTGTVIPPPSTATSDAVQVGAGGGGAAAPPTQ